MAKGTDSLSFEQAKYLLRDVFKNIGIKWIGRKERYSSSLGNIEFRQSKNYGYSSTTWWYTVDPAEVVDSQIEFLWFAADYSGVFVIPVCEFLKYRKKNVVKRLRNGESFNILKKQGKYIRQEPGCEDWDITKYFVKNELKEIQ